MSLEQTLTKIITEGGDLNGFLKPLTKVERKALLPTLSKLKDKYFEFKTKLKKDWDGKWRQQTDGYVHDESYRIRIQKAGLVCADTVTQYRENISWAPEGFSLRDDVIDEIFPWHIPKWFNRSMNRPQVAVWMMDYEKFLKLTQRGYFKPNEEFIANVFINSAFVKTTGEVRQRKSVFTYEFIENNKEALEHHFWTIFENPCNIHAKWRSVKENDYLQIIPNLIEEDKIDRERILEAALLSCTKGFSKPQTAWYYKLLKELKPSQDELIKFQDSLFTCLYSDQSAAIKFGLDHCKKLAPLKAFKNQAFIDSASTLLNSPTKSTISSSLIAIEKIVKKDSEYGTNAALETINVLGFQDQKIQLKAAKIIDKYLKPTEENKALVSAYQSDMYSEVKVLLSKFIEAEQQQVTQIETTPNETELANFLDEGNQIEIPSTIEDIAFYLSKMNEKSELHDSLILPNVLCKLTGIATEENVQKLVPAFNQNMVIRPFFMASRTTHLQGVFINDLAKRFSAIYPLGMSGRESYISKMEAEHGKNDYARKTTLKNTSANKGLMVIKKLWMHASKLFDKGISLLSTPTHKPCWLDPSVLVDRILIHEALGEEIILMDWQVAIFRIPLHYRSDDAFENKLQKIENELLKSILTYLCINNFIPENIEKKDMAWLAPALLSIKDENAINFFTNSEVIDEFAVHNFKWNYDEVSFLRPRWNNEKRKMEKVQAKENNLVFNDLVLSTKYKTKEATNERPNERNFLKWLKKSIIQKAPDPVAKFIPQTLFEHLNFLAKDYRFYENYNSFHYELKSHDVLRFLSLVPNHAQLILSQVVHGHLPYSKVHGEDSKRVVIQCSEFINQTWQRKDEHEIIYVFVAAVLLCDNKIAREILADWWIHYTEANLIDQNKLGFILGKLLQKGYSNLKRLTDNITTRMFKLGKLHDKALYALLSTLTQELPEKPITNTKKILGFLNELKIQHGFSLSEKVVLKVTEYAEQKSLAPIAKKLLK